MRSLRQLHQALLEHKDELAEITTAEVGAPRRLMDGPQLGAPIDLLPYNADLAERHDWSQSLGVAGQVRPPQPPVLERKPVGVVGAITPWD